MNIQHPVALRRSLSAMLPPSKRGRFGASDTDSGGMTAETNLADVIHAALDPAHAPFRLPNSSFTPTVIFSKSRTDTLALHDYFKITTDNPVWMMFPIGPDVPLAYTFYPVTYDTLFTTPSTTSVFNWDREHSADWFHIQSVSKNMSEVEFGTLELPLLMEVHSLGTNLGDTVSSLAFRSAKLRLELKGHSATNLILKGERRFMRVQDPFDITVFDDMDLDNLTSTPKYREPPMALYDDPINIVWGPELCQRYLHKPPNEGKFDFDWFSHEFTLAEGDMYGYTTGSLRWNQRTNFAVSGIHYHPLMFGTGLKLRFSPGAPKEGVVVANLDEITGWRCTVGYFSRTSQSAATLTWRNYTSISGEFEIPLERVFGMRVPDIIVFDPIPPKPIHSSTSEIDWDPENVKCELTLTNCTPLPNGYIRHPLSLLKLTDFESEATLTRTFDIAVEGVSVSSQRHLAPGDHPPVSAYPVESTLLAAHKAFHDPQSSLDYLMTDSEMVAVGVDQRFSEAEMMRTYGAMSFKKFGSGLWRMIKKFAPVAGRFAIKELGPMLGAARYAGPQDPPSY